MDDAATVAALDSDPLALNVRFRVSPGSGLLVYARGAGGRHLSLGVEGGRLVMRFGGGEGEGGAEVRATRGGGPPVDDGLWHRAKAVR